MMIIVWSIVLYHACIISFMYIQVSKKMQDDMEIDSEKESLGKNRESFLKQKVIAFFDVSKSH